MVKSYATTYRFDLSLHLMGKTFRTHLGHALYVNLLPTHDKAHTSTVKVTFILNVPPFPIVAQI